MIICHQQYWQVIFEKDNFSLDYCKDLKAAFNCVRQLICFESGEIDRIILQQEDGTIQESWTSKQFNNMLNVKLS